MQQEFDWTRAEQLGLLDKAVIPRRPGVSPTAMKAVLKAIDGCGRGREAFPGYQYIGLSAGVSERTAKRAVRELVALSLLCVERRGPRTLNHYRIVWSELAILNSRPKCHADTSVDAERSAKCVERSAKCVERSATLTPPKCHGDTLNVTETYKETHTTPEAEGVRVFFDELLEELKKAKLGNPEWTLQLVLAGPLTQEQITERMTAWAALPEGRRSAGKLHNWLTKPWTYQPAIGDTAPKLRLPPLPTNDYEIRRAELIRYGRRQGWPHEKLQLACDRFAASVAQVKEILRA